MAGNQAEEAGPKQLISGGEFLAQSLLRQHEIQADAYSKGDIAGEKKFPGKGHIPAGFVMGQV